MKKSRLTAVFFVSLLCTSCGLMPPVPKQMYPGAPRPIDELAVISEGARGWQYVYQIDDEYVVNPTLGAARITQGLQVLPGRRLVKVKYFSIDGAVAGVTGTEVIHATAEVIIELDAKAGHSYVLIGQREKENISFRFEDKGVGYNQSCLAAELYSKKYLRKEPVPGC